MVGGIKVPGQEPGTLALAGLGLLLVQSPRKHAAPRVDLVRPWSYFALRQRLGKPCVTLLSAHMRPVVLE